MKYSPKEYLTNSLFYSLIFLQSARVSHFHFFRNRASKIDKTFSEYPCSFFVLSLIYSLSTSCLYHFSRLALLNIKISMSRYLYSTLLITMFICDGWSIQKRERVEYGISLWLAECWREILSVNFCSYSWHQFINVINWLYIPRSPFSQLHLF